MRSFLVATLGCLLLLPACSASITEPPGPGPAPGPVCGNGQVEPGEACDDGNADDTDACLTTCVAASCGDGRVRASTEACDDGNSVDTDTCLNTCTLPSCGDGTVQPGESCDDGNTDNTDTCLATCVAASCGDGFVQPGEACDDGNTNDADACTNDCKAPSCGDGLLQPGEACDDGNTDNTDACLDTCVAASCGDGFVQPGETCDDGNTSNTDTCTNACKAAACGDGFPQAGEDCDGAGDSPTCDKDCSPARCGDGYVNVAAGETCDDQNTLDSDGCTSLCLLRLNSTPSATAATWEVDEDGVVSFSLQGTDAEDATVSFTLLTAPSHGVLSGTPPQLTFTPTADYAGADSFTFQVSDGFADSAPATVTLTVRPINDAPSATGAALETDEDTPLSLLLTGADVEGSPLSFTVVTPPSHGSLSGTPPQLTYAPAANFFGVDAFSFRVNDGSADSPPATVALNITSVQDPPAASDSSVATDEDTALVITLPGFDGDGDALSFNLLSSPGIGTLSAVGPGGTVTYTPLPDHNGPDAFTFSVTAGGMTSAPATVSLAVHALNDAPVITARRHVVRSGLPSLLPLQVSDVDGDPLSFMPGPPGHGTVSAQDGQLTYTSAAGYSGPDSFSLEVQDGQGGTATATLDLYVYAPTPPVLAVGHGHACAVRPSGVLTCWGADDVGQLGNGPVNVSWGDNAGETAQGAPAVLFGASGKATSVALGAGHSCALLEDGTVKCWGGNALGQLGTGDTVSLDAPPSAVVPLGAPARALAAGLHFTCALLSDDSVKCWGDNAEGQLGLGHTAAQSAPSDAVTFESGGTELKARTLAAGASHACALLLTGDVTCWGTNASGQLGRGDVPLPTRALRPDGFVPLGAGRKAVEIFTQDAHHVCALLDDATTRCWGDNGSGQLGLGDLNARGDQHDELGDNLPAVDLGPGRVALQVATGSGHTCTRLDDGTARCWGHNDSGQLGLGHTTRTLVPTVAVDLGTARHVRAIAAGEDTSCALLAGDEIKCWGHNAHGQLGLSDTGSRGDGPGELGNSLAACLDFTPPPVAANRKLLVRPGEASTFEIPITDEDSPSLTFQLDASGLSGAASVAGRTVTCTPPPGATDGQALGTLRVTATDPEGQSATAAVEIGVRAPLPTPALSVGHGHACAILSNGVLKCWGNNNSGQLGIGTASSSYLEWGDSPGETGQNAPAIDLGVHLADGTPQTAQVVSAGLDHTCAVLDDGHVKCWGDNTTGELGAGHQFPFELPPGDPINLGTDASGQALTARDVSASVNYTCALLSDDSIKCWGVNHWGQLGTGNVAARTAPGPAVTFKGGTVLRARALTTGVEHACALLLDGTVSCWGRDWGRLGQEKTSSVLDDYWPSPPLRLGTGLKALELSRGRAIHTCAILDDATTKCWGENWDGQLGTGDLLTRGDDPGEMGDGLSELVLGAGRSVLEVSTSGGHTCVRLDDGNVQCWGFNNTGQLGLGDITDTSAPSKAVDLGTGLRARGLSAGLNNTCALLDGDLVKCWGDGAYGQLGNSSFQNRGDNPGELGDNQPAALDLTPAPVGVTRTLLVRAGIPNTFEIPLFDDDNPVLDYQVDASGLQHQELVRSGRWMTYVAPAGVGEGQSLGQLVVHATDPNGQSATSTLELVVRAELTQAPLSVGGGHVCAIVSGGTLQCWGKNGFGQLGLGSALNWGDQSGEPAQSVPAVPLGTGRTAVSVSAGENHTCALLDDGSVKCWGANASGQLGLGDTAHRGDSAGELGDALPAVDLGATARAVACGQAFSCALLTDDTVKCWGSNTEGQLGIIDVMNQGDGPGEMGANLDRVTFYDGTPLKARALRTGAAHACAVLLDGNVACWGQNSGRLGLGFTPLLAQPYAPTPLGSGLQVMELATHNSGHTCAILSDASLKCWGQGTSGQLGFGSSTTLGDSPTETGDKLPVVNVGAGRLAQEVAAGGLHTCARLDDGALKCWGSNSQGQLGLGNTSLGQLPGNPVNLGTGLVARALAVGGTTSCALLDGDLVKCWGGNGSGQLGLGNTLARGDQANELGDVLPACFDLSPP